MCDSGRTALGVGSNGWMGASARLKPDWVAAPCGVPVRSAGLSSGSLDVAPGSQMTFDVMLR